MKDKNWKLLKFRTKLGLTQEEVALKMGFKFLTYHRVENGETKGSMEFWKRFKDVFQISDAEIWYFMNNEEN